MYVYIYIYNIYIYIYLSYINRICKCICNISYIIIYRICSIYKGQSHKGFETITLGFMFQCLFNWASKPGTRTILAQS